MTQQGKYQFMWMRFGLKGAPACLQRLMDTKLGDTQAFCAAYLVDIIVYSLTWDDQREHLLKVITCLMDHELII